jgi:hypothetical protein
MHRISSKTPASRYFDAITSAAFAPAILAGAFSLALGAVNVAAGLFAGISLPISRSFRDSSPGRLPSA